MSPAEFIDSKIWEAYVLPNLSAGERYDLSAVFGSEAPLEIEIGSGKGQFLLDAALAEPERRWLGIEVKQKLTAFIASELHARALRHVRLIVADAFEVLHQRLPRACAAGVHLYFPDPWWKRRHYKRRVFTPTLFSAIADVLQIGGHLHIATDVDFAFEAMLASAFVEPRLVMVAGPGALGDQVGLITPTTFERKAKKSHRPIQRARFQRR